MGMGSNKYAKRRFTIDLGINTKDAEKQLGAVVGNFKTILSDLGNAADKMTYFKELVDYVGQLDQALSSLETKHKGIAQEIFGNVDKVMKDTLSGLLGASYESVSGFNSIMQKLNAADPTQIKTAELKKLAQEVQDLYGAAGVENKLNMDNFGPGKGKQFSPEQITDRLEILKGAVLDFAKSFDETNKRIKNGFGFGTGAGKDYGIGTYFDNVADLIRSKIKPIEDEIERYENVLKRISRAKVIQEYFSQKDEIDDTKKGAIDKFESDFRSSHDGFNLEDGAAQSKDETVAILKEYQEKHKKFNEIYIAYDDGNASEEQLFDAINQRIEVTERLIASLQRNIKSTNDAEQLFELLNKDGISNKSISREFLNGDDDYFDEANDDKSYSMLSAVRVIMSNLGESLYTEDDMPYIEKLINDAKNKLESKRKERERQVGTISERVQAALEGVDTSGTTGSGSSGGSGPDSDAIKNAAIAYDELIEKLREYKSLMDQQNNNAEIDENKLEDLQKYFDELSKAKPIEEIQAIQDVLGDIEYENLAPEDAIERLREFLNIAQQMSAESPDGQATGTGGTATGANEKTINDLEYIVALAGQLKEMFATMSRRTDFEYNISVNGLDIQALKGIEKQVGYDTQVGSYLDNLFSPFAAFGHSHQGGSKSFNIQDMLTYLDEYKNALNSFSFVVGHDGIETLNFGGINLEDIEKIKDAINALGRSKNAPLKIDEINQIVENITGVKNVLQTWKPSQIDDLAKYMYEVAQNAEAAIDPVERLQKIFDSFYGAGKVDVSKHGDLLSQLMQGNARDIFNQIAQKEGLAHIGAGSPLSIQQVNDDIDENIAKYQRQRDEARLTYETIREEVAKVLNAYKEGATISYKTDFFDNFFSDGEWLEIRGLLTNAYEDLISIEEAQNRIAERFGVDPESYDKIPTGHGTGTGSGGQDGTGSTSKEVADLEEVRKKVAEIEGAVKLKTQAFNDEQLAVDGVVTKEIESLKRLEEYLGTLKTVIDESVSTPINQWNEKIESLYGKIQQLGTEFAGINDLIRSLGLHFEVSDNTDVHNNNADAIQREADATDRLKKVRENIGMAAFHATSYDKDADLNHDIGKEFTERHKSELLSIIGNDPSKIEAELKSWAQQLKNGMEPVNEAVSRISKLSEIPKELHTTTELYQEAAKVGQRLSTMYDDGITDTEEYIALQHKLLKLFDKISVSYGGLKGSGAKDKNELRRWMYNSLKQDTGFDVYDSSVIDALYETKNSIYDSEGKKQSMRAMVANLFGYDLGPLGFENDLKTLKDINDLLSVIEKRRAQLFPTQTHSADIATDADSDKKFAIKIDTSDMETALTTATSAISAEVDKVVGGMSTLEDAVNSLSGKMQDVGGAQNTDVEHGKQIDDNNIELVSTLSALSGALEALSQKLGANINAQPESPIINTNAATATSQLESVDLATEIAQCNELLQIINLIIDRVNAKTEAFENEKKQVNVAVHQEMQALKVLGDYLTTLKESIGGLLDNVPTHVNDFEQWKQDTAAVGQNLSGILKNLKEIGDISQSVTFGTGGHQQKTDTTGENPHYVTDPQGKLKYMYRGIHGAYGGLVSNRYHGGTFSTDDIEVARTYAGELGKVEKVLLSMKNPFEVDGNGALWKNLEYIGDRSDEASHRLHELNSEILANNELLAEAQKIQVSEEEKKKINRGLITLADTKREKEISYYTQALESAMAEKKAIFADSSNPYGIKTTNEIVELAKAAGYDGVIFKDIVDSANKNVNQASTVMVTFAEEQIHYIETIGATFESAIGSFKTEYGELAKYVNLSSDEIHNAIVGVRDLRQKLNSGEIAEDEYKNLLSQIPMADDISNIAHRQHMDDDFIKDALNDTGSLGAISAKSLVKIIDEFISAMRKRLQKIATTFEKTDVPLNQLLDENTYNSHVDPINDQQKTPSSDGYALEKTLQETNGILGQILKAFGDGTSFSSLVEPLKAAVEELKNVSNGVIEEHKRKKVDTIGARERIANSYDELASHASNAVTGLGDSDSIKIKGMRPLTDDIVRVEGVIKDASGTWKGFFVDVDNANKATIAATNTQSSYAKELNDTADAAEKASSAEKQDPAKKIAEEVANSERARALQKITGQVNLEKGSLGFNFNARNLEPDQNKIVGAYDALIAEIDKYEIAIKNGQNATIDGIEKEKNALFALIDAYKEKNGIVNAGRTGNKKAPGATVVKNAITKFNALNNAVNTKELKQSSAVQDAFENYKKAYDNLVKMQKGFKVGQVLSKDEDQKFNDARIACSNYAKELEKLLRAYQKAKDEGDQSKRYEFEGDFVDDIPGRQKAFNNFLQETYGSDATFEKFNKNFNEMIYTVNNGDGTFTTMTAKINSARTAIDVFAGETKEAKSAIGALWDELKGKFRSIFTYMTASMSMHDIIRVVRQGVGYVREIDSALTELKKVTDETDASYDKFLQNMSKTGSVVGATVANLTTMAAEWARLGYNIEDSAKLAESTAILLNVSEFDDATAASEALISTMQAFQYTADESQHVVDILNEVKVTCLHV